MSLGDDDEFAQRHRDTLAAAAHALSHLELAIDLTLRTTARLVAEPLGEGCIVALFGEGRSSLGLASAWHVDPDARARFDELARAPQPWFVKLVTSAAAKRLPMFHAAVESDPSFPVSSAVVAPIVLGGAVLGAVSVLRASGTFDDDELSLVQALADRAALPIDNARLHLRARESEERLRLALEASGLGSWDLDLRTGVLRADFRFRKLFGLGGDDDLDFARFFTIIHPDDRETARERILDALAPENGGQFEMDLRAAAWEDTPRWITATGRVLFGQGQRPIRVVGTVRDISPTKLAHEERTRLYEKARAAVTLRDEFLSIASHELRTPLTAMRLHLDSLARTFAREQRDAQTVARALAQADRLSRLVDRLFDVSRITAGRLPLDRESVDVSAVAREVVERFDDVSAREKTPIHLEAPAPVVGDFDRMAIDQALTNLIANALKHAPGKSVDVRIEATDDDAVLTVRDHGPGIPPEHQARIFERFERVGRATRASGLGLGLYITREIARAHGGTITLESELGQGATFCVRLPFEPPPPSSRAL